MTDTDEIERLRALWCEEKSKSMTFHAEIERLRVEVARVTAERDEARREVCEWVCCGFDRAKDAAKMRGWDCFKGGGA